LVTRSSVSMVCETVAHRRGSGGSIERPVLQAER